MESKTVISFCFISSMLEPERVQLGLTCMNQTSAMSAPNDSAESCYCVLQGPVLIHESMGFGCMILAVSIKSSLCMSFFRPKGCNPLVSLKDAVATYHSREHLSGSSLKKGLFVSDTSVTATSPNLRHLREGVSCVRIQSGPCRKPRLWGGLDLLVSTSCRADLG